MSFKILGKAYLSALLSATSFLPFSLSISCTEALINGFTRFSRHTASFCSGFAVQRNEEEKPIVF